MKLYQLDDGSEENNSVCFYCNGSKADIEDAVEEKNKRLEDNNMTTFSDEEEVYEILEERGFKVDYIDEPTLINY